MESIRKSLRFQDEEEKTGVEGYLEEAENACPSLSWEQRFWGFGICVVVASILSFMVILSFLLFLFFSFFFFSFLFFSDLFCLS